MSQGAFGCTLQAGNSSCSRPTSTLPYALYLGTDAVFRPEIGFCLFASACYEAGRGRVVRLLRLVCPAQRYGRAGVVLGVVGVVQHSAEDDEAKEPHHKADKYFQNHSLLPLFSLIISPFMASLAVARELDPPAPPMGS